jgi:hypothetical protein
LGAADIRAALRLYLVATSLLATALLGLWLLL